MVVVTAACHVVARMKLRTSLAEDDRASGHQRAIRRFHSETLGL